MTVEEQREAEANYFAMHLLVPTEALKKAVNAAGGIDLCDDDALKKLAKKFGVSLTIIAFRMGEEGLMAK